MHLMKEGYRTSGYFRLVRASRGGSVIPGPVPAPRDAVPEGFLMLFTDDWRPVDVANQFMMAGYKPIKTRRWQNTQKARAQDLAQWWTYLSANEIEWDRATQADVDDYESRMADAVSPKTSLQFGTSTVRRRVGTVASLYSWAAGHGIISASPLPDDTDIKENGRPIGSKAAFLPHLGTARLPRLPKVRAKGRDPEKDPRPLKLKRLDGILDRLGPPIFKKKSVFALAEWEPNTASRRNRLMAEVALYTGMRVDEIAGISRLDLIAQMGKLDPGRKFEEGKLRVRTKGQVFRDVVVPSFILKALLLYHDIERAAAIQAAKSWAEEHGRRYDEPIELFVNSVDANGRDVGRAIRPEIPSRQFTKAAIAHGLTVEVEGFELDPETFERIYDREGKAVTKKITVAAHTFHDLRHTFAVRFYAEEVKRSREPWDKIRSLLGHATVETTKNIYLRHVDTDEAKVGDNFTAYLRMGLDAVR